MAKQDAVRSSQFVEMAVKVLIKLTKALPQALQQPGRVDVDMVLFSVHTFLMSLGVEEIRKRGSEDDKPLRMIKTLLHELCKVLCTEWKGRGVAGLALAPVAWPLRLCLGRLGGVLLVLASSGRSMPSSVRIRGFLDGAADSLFLLQGGFGFLARPRASGGWLHSAGVSLSC